MDKKSTLNNLKQRKITHYRYTYELGLSCSNLFYFEVVGGYYDREMAQYYDFYDESAYRSIDDINEVKNPTKLLRAVLREMVSMVYSNKLRFFGFRGATEKKRELFRYLLPKIEKAFPHYDFFETEKGHFWAYRRQTP